MSASTGQSFPSETRQASPCVRLLAMPGVEIDCNGAQPCGCDTETWTPEQWNHFFSTTTKTFEQWTAWMPGHWTPLCGRLYPARAWMGSPTGDATFALYPEGDGDAVRLDEEVFQAFQERRERLFDCYRVASSSAEASADAVNVCFPCGHAFNLYRVPRVCHGESSACPTCGAAIPL